MPLSDWLGPQFGALQNFQMQRLWPNGQMPGLNHGGLGQFMQTNIGMPGAGAFGGFTPRREISTYAPDADPNNPYKQHFAGSGLTSPQMPAQQTPERQPRVMPAGPVAIDQSLQVQPGGRRGFHY